MSKEAIRNATSSTKFIPCVVTHPMSTVSSNVLDMTEIQVSVAPPEFPYLQRVYLGKHIPYRLSGEPESNEMSPRNTKLLCKQLIIAQTRQALVDMCRSLVLTNRKQFCGSHEPK